MRLAISCNIKPYMGTKINNKNLIITSAANFMVTLRFLKQLHSETAGNRSTMHL